MNQTRPNFRLVVTERIKTIVEGSMGDDLSDDLGRRGGRGGGLRLPVVPRGAAVRAASARAKAESRKLNEKIADEEQKTRAEYDAEEVIVEAEEQEEKIEDAEAPEATAGVGASETSEASPAAISNTPAVEEEGADYVFPEPKGGKYVYRQLKDGTILIIESPRGVYPTGREPRLTRRSHPKPWLAISNAIQAQKAGKRADTLKAFATIASAASAVVVAAIAPPPPPRGRRRRQREAPLPPPPPPESGFPWVPVAIGTAVVVGILAVAGGSR